MWVGVWRPHKPRGPIAALYSSPGPKYALPGCTGSEGQDIRKFKAPAFSFGIRRVQLSSSISPGPGHLVPSNIIRTGQSSAPAYSLYGRPKDPQRFLTPAPGRYAPERSGQSVYHSAPAYSMSSRTGGFYNPASPGPAAYMLPAVLGTKAVSKRSAPSFSLTGKSKVGSFHEDLAKSPGPGTYKVVDPSSYKFKPPQYSMIGRNVMPGDRTEIPGPATYRPEGVTFTKRKAPDFSFGIRHSEFSTPVLVDREH